MNDNMRISIVRIQPSEKDYMEDLPFVEAMRDKLAWKTVSYDQYQNLFRHLPKGMKVVVDSAHNSRSMAQEATLDISVALTRQEQFRQQKINSTVDKNQLNKAGPEKKQAKTTRKGLTAKQKAELEQLRKELGNG